MSSTFSMLLALLLSVLMTAGCARCDQGPAQTPPESQTTAAESSKASQPTTAGSERGTAGQRASASKTPAKPSTAATAREAFAQAERNDHPSLRALRVAARKLLAADRAVVANQLGYHQAVERTEREIKSLRLEHRMPSEPVQMADIRPSVEAIARQNGLVLVDLRVGTPNAKRAVPATHQGPGPYAYHADQIIGQQPLTIKLHPVDDAAAATFYNQLKTLPGPLLDIQVVREDASAKRMIFSGVIPNLLEVEPPKKAPRTPSLSELARSSDVELPDGSHSTEDIQKTLDEHRELHAGLTKSMVYLGQTHLLGLQLRFARERLESNASRPFPTPLGRKGPDLQRQK